jgi:membrane-associated phospholipid phosphatase
VSGHAYEAQSLARPSAGRPWLSGAGGPLGVATLCLLGLVAIWTAASQLPSVEVKDAVALHDFTLLDRPTIEAVGAFLLHLLEPLLFTIWGAAMVLVAIARDRPRVAFAVALLLMLTPFTAETLKPLLAHPHASVGGVHIGAASWPSGHSTAAMTLVLCAVLVAPRNRRVLVAVIGACYAAVVGVMLLVLAWHMPSDVLGGYLLAGLFAALAVAGLRLADSRWPPVQL